MPDLTLPLTEALGRWFSLSEPQFPHPQNGAEGRPSSAHWGEDERKCNMGHTWHTGGVQNLGVKSLSSLLTQMPPHTALPAVAEYSRLLTGL